MSGKLLYDLRRLEQKWRSEARARQALADRIAWDGQLSRAGQDPAIQYADELTKVLGFHATTEAHASARLSAAAPELLAVAQFAERIFLDLRSDGIEYDFAFITDAIAKATGNKP